MRQKDKITLLNDLANNDGFNEIKTVSQGKDFHCIQLYSQFILVVIF